MWCRRQKSGIAGWTIGFEAGEERRTHVSHVVKATKPMAVLHNDLQGRFRIVGHGNPVAHVGKNVRKIGTGILVIVHNENLFC